jgi:putative salt-induced outer membrane protein YdiY
MLTARLPVFLSVAALLCLAPALQAAEQPGLFAQGDLSLVQTSGNSTAGTVGFKGTLTKNWLRTSFVGTAGGVRTTTSKRTRTATGLDAASAIIGETSVSTTSAENLFAGLQARRRMTEQLSWMVAGDWLRDRISGIDYRLVESAGLGYDLSQREGLKLQATLAATLTQEGSVVEDPGAKKAYPGVRAAYDYEHQVTPSTKLIHDLVLDVPFTQTDNFLVAARAGVQVAMSKALSLKAEVRLRYDNVPALEQLELVRSDGTRTGLKVNAPLEKLDTQATVALVLNFSRAAGVGKQATH